MRAPLRLLSACLICAALAGCGGGSGGSGGSDRQQITNLFTGMYGAITHGDFATACGYLSQRQRDNVLASAKRAGVTASSCSGALTSLLQEAGITRARLAQALGAGAATRKLDSISVHGNQATVTFSETTGGQKYVETDALVREGGRWRADRIVKRSLVR